MARFSNVYDPSKPPEVLSIEPRVGGLAIEIKGGVDGWRYFVTVDKQNVPLNQANKGRFKVASTEAQEHTVNVERRKDKEIVQPFGSNIKMSSLDALTIYSKSHKDIEQREQAIAEEAQAQNLTPQETEQLRQNYKRALLRERKAELSRKAQELSTNLETILEELAAIDVILG